MRFWLATTSLVPTPLGHVSCHERLSSFFEATQMTATDQRPLFWWWAALCQFSKTMGFSGHRVYVNVSVPGKTTRRHSPPQRSASDQQPPQQGNASSPSWICSRRARTVWPPWSADATAMTSCRRSWMWVWASRWSPTSRLRTSFSGGLHPYPLERLAPAHDHASTVNGLWNEIANVTAAGTSPASRPPPTHSRYLSYSRIFYFFIICATVLTV